MDRDQIARINYKRAIKHGGLKLILGFIIAVACVLAGVQSVAHLHNGLTSYWAYYSAIYIALVTLVCVIYIFRGMYFIELRGINLGDRWPFKWLVRYIDSNIRGWWLIYARCNTHDIYALALKSPTGEIRWIVPLVRNLFPSDTCTNINFLFIPLGGWWNRPFIYAGVASQLVHHPDRHTYADYQWQVRISHEDPACEWMWVWLTDTNASRVRLLVWDALTIAHEVALLSGNNWIGEHAMRFLRQRNEAREAACALYDDLAEANQRVFATRRFIHSKQGLAIRVWLLDRLCSWNMNLGYKQIRRGTDAERAELNSTWTAARAQQSLGESVNRDSVA